MATVKVARKTWRPAAATSWAILSARSARAGPSRSAVHSAAWRLLLRLKLPAVAVLEDRAGVGPLQPRQRRRVAAEVSVPERRRQREDHASVVRVALLLVPGQRAVGTG